MKLQPRLQIVLEMLAGGAGTEDIARRLSIGYATARHYIRLCREALGASTRGSIVSEGYNAGLLSAGQDYRAKYFGGGDYANS